MEMLDVITKARGLLDKGYIKWRMCDGKGNYCASGAVAMCSGAKHEPRTKTVRFTSGHGMWMAAMTYVDGLARQMYPDLKGKVAARQDSVALDYFNVTPMVYLNNQVGKEAVLEVFDEAIRRLTPVVTMAPVPAEWKAVEKETVNV